MMPVIVDPRAHTYLQRFVDTPEDHIEDMDHCDVRIIGSRGVTKEYVVLSSSAFYDAVITGEMNDVLKYVDAVVVVTVMSGREPSPAILYDFMNGVQRHHPVFLCESYTQCVDFLRKERRRLDDGTYGLWLTRHTNKEAPTVNMLCMIPSIGYKTANRIVDIYPTMVDIISALMQDTFKVDGIGLKIKAVLMEYLGGDREEDENVDGCGTGGENAGEVSLRTGTSDGEDPQ